jgi:hypothetical protein
MYEIDMEFLGLMQNAVHTECDLHVVDLFLSQVMPFHLPCTEHTLNTEVLLPRYIHVF